MLICHAFSIKKSIEMEPMPQFSAKIKLTPANSDPWAISHTKAYLGQWFPRLGYVMHSTKVTDLVLYLYNSLQLIFLLKIVFVFSIGRDSSWTIYLEEMFRSRFFFYHLVLDKINSVQKILPAVNRRQWI